MRHVSRVFAGTRDTISAARCYVGRHFEEEDRDNAVLALSEIATNVITHGGGGEYQVTVCKGNETTRVLVKGFQNAPSELTHDHRPGDYDTGGRGLLLVGLCTSAWGTLIDSDGIMAVWFEIAHTHAHIAQAA